MDCLVLACVVATAGPPLSGVERIQEQFERHYLQRPQLAGPDRPAGPEASMLAAGVASQPFAPATLAAQAGP